MKNIFSEKEQRRTASLLGDVMGNNEDTSTNKEEHAQKTDHAAAASPPHNPLFPLVDTSEDEEEEYHEEDNNQGEDNTTNSKTHAKSIHKDHPEDKGKSTAAASATGSASSPPLLIQPWHVVLGDTHAGYRTTAATKLLRSIKEQFKASHKGLAKKKWIPLAIQAFQEAVREQFADKDKNNLPHDSPELGRVLLKCNSSNNTNGSPDRRILVPNIYQYEGDAAPTYGTAKAYESLEFFLSSRDAPTLASELARHLQSVQKLMRHCHNNNKNAGHDTTAPTTTTTTTAGPPAYMVQGFYQTLQFFQEKLDAAYQGDVLAEKLLDSLKPINSLKEQWKMLEQHCGSSSSSTISTTAAGGGGDDASLSVGGYSSSNSYSGATAGAATFEDTSSEGMRSSSMSLSARRKKIPPSSFLASSFSSGDGTSLPKWKAADMVTTGVPTYRKHHHHHHSERKTAARQQQQYQQDRRTSPVASSQASLPRHYPFQHHRHHQQQYHQHQQQQNSMIGNSVVFPVSQAPQPFSMSPLLLPEQQNQHHRHDHGGAHHPTATAFGPEESSTAASATPGTNQRPGGVNLQEQLDEDGYQDPIAPPDMMMLDNHIMEHDLIHHPYGVAIEEDFHMDSVLPLDWEWNESLPSRSTSPAEEGAFNAASSQPPLDEEDWESLLPIEDDDVAMMPVSETNEKMKNASTENNDKPSKGAYSPAWMLLKLAAVASALGLHSFKEPKTFVPPDHLGKPSRPVIDLPNLPDPATEKDLSCPQDIVCVDVMEALYPVFPVETFPRIGVPGTCQNWAREWLLSNKDIKTFNVERIRQRYAMAMLYCETGGEEWVEHELWVSDMHECDWNSEIGVDPCNRHEQVQVIRNQGQHMRGTLPPELSMMTTLWELTLSDNLLTGTIPSSYAELSELDTLSLSFNLFDGQVPDILWGFEDMIHLDIAYNSFSGTLPDTLYYTMPALRDLFVELNVLNGTIPHTFGQLNWQRLHMDGNNLEGKIPEDINAGKLRELMLHNNNLTGTFPADSFATEWSGRRSKLEKVTLYENNLEGDVNVMCSLMTDSTIGNLDTFAVDLEKVTCECCSGPP